MEKLKNEYLWESVVFARTLEELMQASMLLSLNECAISVKQYGALHNALAVKLQALA